MQRYAQSVLKKSFSHFYPSSSSSSSLNPRPISSIPPHYSAPKFAFVPKPTRSFSSNGGGSSDPTREIDDINVMFAEAREEIESALESKETVYFDEEAECARDAVKGVLDKFNNLMAALPEKEKMALQRSMGLKIQRLKAELDQLNE